MSDDLVGALHDLETAEIEIDRLRADLAAAKARIQELEVAIGIIIKERDEANFAGAELREKLEKPLNFQWETGGAELAAKDARIAELEAQYKKSDQQCAIFHAERDMARADIEALINRIGETETVLSYHKKQHGLSGARIAELETYHTNCTDYINQLLGNMADDDKERVAILARAERAEASLLYEATETRIAMEQLQDRAERAEARIAELEANAVETELEWSKLCAERERAMRARAEHAEARVAELEATILHWTSEVTRLEQNCDDDQDRAERVEDALKEQLQWKKSYTERAERAEAERDAAQKDLSWLADAFLSHFREPHCLEALAPIVKGIADRGRAALATSPAGREE